MLKLSLYDYIDVFILIKGTISVKNMAAADAVENNANKKLYQKAISDLKIFKNLHLLIV